MRPYFFNDSCKHGEARAVVVVAIQRAAALSAPSARSWSKICFCSYSLYAAILFLQVRRQAAERGFHHLLALSAGALCGFGIATALVDNLHSSNI